jgi:hypothetical protein
MDIKKEKQINQKYTSEICKYISTCVLFNTDQTLFFSTNLFLWCNNSQWILDKNSVDAEEKQDMVPEH